MRLEQWNRELYDAAASCRRVVEVQLSADDLAELRLGTPASLWHEPAGEPPMLMGVSVRAADATRWITEPE